MKLPPHRSSSVVPVSVGGRILTRQIGNSKCCTMSRIYGAVLSFVQDLWTAVKVTVRRRPGFAADTGVSRDALEHFCSLARGRGICHFQTVCQLEDFTKAAEVASSCASV